MLRHTDRRRHSHVIYLVASLSILRAIFSTIVFCWNGLAEFTVNFYYYFVVKLNCYDLKARVDHHTFQPDPNPPKFIASGALRALQCYGNGAPPATSTKARAVSLPTVSMKLPKDGGFPAVPVLSIRLFSKLSSPQQRGGTTKDI